MDMMVTYKILYGLVNVPIEEVFQYNNFSTKSSGLKLQKHHTVQLNYNFTIPCVNLHGIMGGCF